MSEVAGPSGRRGDGAFQSEGLAMVDVGLVVLTILLFGLLALALRGVERL